MIKMQINCEPPKVQGECGVEERGLERDVVCISAMIRPHMFVVFQKDQPNVSIMFQA